MERRRPLLSISILISKPTESFVRCLESLKEIREKLHTELILVYTGTQEEVIAQLEPYADRIVRFAWCNDFSKARNAGMEKAQGEWFLYIDDDEWFAETEELTQFFESGEYRRYGYANYIQRNFFDPNYLNYTDSWATRMVRLEPETRFRSRIHEYFYPVYGQGKNLRVVANHSGYIYMTKEERKKRYDRNAHLLRNMMEEEPDNLRWSMQLAQECYAVEAWQELVMLCREQLVKCGQKGAINSPHLAGTFYAGWVEGLIGLEQYADALQAAKRAEAVDSYGMLLKAYLYLAEGEIYFRLKQWENAKKSIEQYIDLKENIIRDEAQYAIWQEALIVDGAYDMVSVKKAYSILIGSALELGDTEPMRAHFGALEWDKQSVYVYQPFLSVLQRRMLEDDESEAFDMVWLAIWANEKLYQLSAEEAANYLSMSTKRQKLRHQEFYRANTYRILQCIYRKDVLGSCSELLPAKAQRALHFLREIEDKGENAVCPRSN